MRSQLQVHPIHGTLLSQTGHGFPYRYAPIICYLLGVSTASSTAVFPLSFIILHGTSHGHMIVVPRALIVHLLDLLVRRRQDYRLAVVLRLIPASARTRVTRSISTKVRGGKEATRLRPRRGTKEVQKDLEVEKPRAFGVL